MIYFSQERWERHDVVSEHHRFFVQHWHEILDPFTPDTWQTRTTNFPTMLSELIDVIDVSSQHESFRHNIPDLCRELRHTYELDPVIRLEFRDVAESLWVAVGADLQGSKINSLRQTVQVAIEQLNGNYAPALVRYLRAELAKEKASKQSLYRLTMALAVEWLASGYSMPYLREGLDVLLDTPNQPFLQRFDRFVDRCKGTKQRYSCSMGVSLPQEALRAAFDDFKVQIGLPSARELTEIERMVLQGSPQDAFITCAVSAKDPHSAASLAEEKVEGLLASLNLFYVRNRFEVKGRFVLAIDDENSDDQYAIGITRCSPFGYNADQPIERHDRLQKLFARFRHEDRDRLQGALQHHRHAATSPTDESKLVNLWTALECLCPRERSLIEDVCSNVAPSVAIGHSRKMITLMCRYVWLSWREKPGNWLTSIFPRSSKYHIDSADMLDAILEPVGGQKANAIYALISENYLLRFRFWRMQERTFGSAAKHKESLQMHRDNLDWQLKRIYRARNQIVHRGRAGDSLPRLVQHLQTYLLATFHNIIHDLEQNPSLGVIEAFRFRRVLYDQTVRRLTEASNVGGRPFLREHLLQPSTLLNTAAGTPAWLVPVNEHNDVDPKK